MLQTCITFVLLILINCIFADQISNCGDWEPYKDLKCFKILDNNNLKNFDDAKNSCYQLDGSDLMSIRSQEEQDFLFNLLNDEYNIVNNVWLGIEFRADVYKWSDSSALNYTNWANGNPVNESGYDCVQLVLNQPYNGQWFNKPCNLTNVVVCEKMQKWKCDYLIKTIIEMRDELQATKSDLEITKNDLQNQLETTKTQLQNEIVKATPSGTIAYFARSSQPLGWLKANGQVVSRTTYANLFERIGTTFGSGDGNTTFTLPDLRGEFIRGWSDGRDVDSNRAFGSFQWGSSIPLVGYVDGYWARSIADGYQDGWGFTGPSFDNGFEGNVVSGETRDRITFPNDKTIAYVATTASGYVSTWNVMKGTRPRNIALLACIKY